MAVANVAAWLSIWGKKVLVVDWDLEAPGLHRYLDPWLPAEKFRGGVADIVSGMGAPGKQPDWRLYVVSASLPVGTKVDLLPAGSLDSGYVEKLQQIDWPTLFEEHDIGAKLERLRQEWTSAYDIVLIDSRTGITDVGGICTILLPDVVVGLYTANKQSVDGLKDTLERARRGHATLPVDRMRLLTVPVLCRDESEKEFEPTFPKRRAD